MSDRSSLAAGALFALLAVALGAFGAHALETRLSPAAMHTWETSARYHLFHALALVATANVRTQGRATRVAATAFTVGIVLFSGSLYAVALGAPRVLGAVTPFGGLSFMLGWAALAASVLRSPAR